MKDRAITSRKVRMPDEDGDCSDKIVECLYDRQGDKFYVQLPGYLAYKTDEKTVDVKGESPKLALDAAEQVCEDFRGMIFKKRRVIIYQLGWRKRGEAGDQMGNSSDRGTGLRVHWHACWEFKVSGVVRWGHEDRVIVQFGKTERCPSRLEGEWVVPKDHWRGTWKTIDWTQEREDFFRSLETGLVALIDRAKQVMGSPRGLGAMIDARPTTRLLEGPR